MNALVRRLDFTDPREAVDFAQCHRSWSAQGGDKWIGQSETTCYNWATQGAEELVGPSDAFLNAFEDKLPASSRMRWAHDIAGSLPNVPRYLTGSDPRVMRRKRQFMEDRAPIRIYVDVHTSASISPNEYLKRGAAVLAFLRCAQALRPIELYAISAGASDPLWKDHSTQIHIITVRLPSAPLNVSLVAAWLSSPTLFRRYLLDGPIKDFRWPNSWGLKAGDLQNGRALMNLNPQDVLIPGAYSGDPIVTNPVKWIEDRIAEITSED